MQHVGRFSSNGDNANDTAKKKRRAFNLRARHHIEGAR